MAAEVPLWTPTQDQIDAAPLTAFTKAAAVKAGVTFSSYSQLHGWSVEDREGF
jgi:acetoacetyl-CoA synthetase